MADKLGALVAGDWRAHRYGRIYEDARERAAPRLVVAADEGQVELLLRLIGSCSEPFGLLYVLLVGILDFPTGRYQLDDWLSMERLSEILRTHRDFIEQDARHNVWLHSPTDETTLVYDRHNLIYVYGDLELARTSLKELGFKVVDEVRVPAPHRHPYHSDFDEAQRGLLTAFQWYRTDLVPGQDDP